MFLNKEKIKLILNKEKALLKTKIFWFVIALGILFTVGLTVPAYSFLQLPLQILFAGTIPGIFAIQCSIPFAVRFISLHKRFHKKSHSYVWSEIKPKDPPTWKFALSTTAYSFSITYNIMTWLGFEDEIFTTGNRLGLFVLIGLFSLFGAIITHVAIFLLTKSGLMYKDSSDGSRMNLGKEMLSKLDWAISPLVLISLGHGILKHINEPLTFSLLGSILGIFTVNLYASFFSFYFLKKVHSEKLMNRLRERLDKTIAE